MSCRVKMMLHGHLQDLCPQGMEFEAETAAEAINGLCRQTKAFNVPPTQQKHVIKVLGFDSEGSLYAPLSNVKELHLFPQMAGGKSGGFIQIAIGAVIIAASFIPGLNVAVWGSLISTTFSSLLFSAGLSLVLGGLLTLVSPAPKMDGSGNVADPDGSKYLGANQNTVTIGTRIPLLYGLFMAYGQYLSFDVDAVDVAV